MLYEKKLIQMNSVGHHNIVKQKSSNKKQIKQLRARKITFYKMGFLSKI